MKVDKIQIEGSLKLEAVCNYLSDIASSLRDGQMCVIKDADFVTLVPSDQMEISIAAGKKKGKEKLTLKLTWDTPLGSEQCPTMFAISSQEPKCDDAPKSEESSDSSDAQAPQAPPEESTAQAKAAPEAPAPVETKAEPLKTTPKPSGTAAKKNAKKPAKAAAKK